MNNNKVLMWSDNHKKRYTWLYNKLKTLKIHDIIYNESNYINKLTAVKIINIIKMILVGLVILKNHYFLWLPDG